MAILKLSEFIENNVTLKILNVSWNRITEKGAVPLLKSITNKSVLRDLNLAYNKLGKLGSLVVVNSLGDVINAGFLKHLNLSYTDLDYTHCQVLAELIEKNHTLFGLHLQGNK
jgi:Ran GTPase-activating protein (RanGAP) involved in mRNA processing and transport